MPPRAAAPSRQLTEPNYFAGNEPPEREGGRHDGVRIADPSNDLLRLQDQLAALLGAPAGESRALLGRRFTLPDANRYDRDGITARLVNGVLDVKLPKSEKAKPRKIPVIA